MERPEDQCVTPVQRIIFRTQLNILAFGCLLSIFTKKLHRSCSHRSCSHIGFHAYFTYFTYISHTDVPIIDSKQIDAGWKGFPKSK